MIYSSLKIKGRYSEVDKLVIVYYSRYLEYFEIGRGFLLETKVLSYNQIENKFRFGLPVIESFIKYNNPARYNDELTVITKIEETVKRAVTFKHKIYSKDNKTLICSGYTKNIFFNLQTNKVEMPSIELLECFNMHFVTLKLQK